MVSDRAFTFHIYIPRGKSLSLVQKSRSNIKVSFRKNGRCGGVCLKYRHVIVVHKIWKTDESLVFNAYRVYCTFNSYNLQSSRGDNSATHCSKAINIAHAQLHNYIYCEQIAF